MANPGTASAHNQFVNLFNHLSGQRVGSTSTVEQLDTIDYYDYLLERYNLNDQRVDEVIEADPELAARIQTSADRFLKKMPQLHPEADNPERLSQIYAACDWLEQLENQRNTGGKDRKLRFTPDYKALYFYMSEQNLALPKPAQRPKVKRVATFPIQLVVEPHLQGMPAKQLAHWNKLSDDEIRELGSSEVDYYLSSPRQLKQYDQIITPYGRVKGPDGTSWYQYRLSGQWIQEAKNQGFTKTMRMRKFDAQIDDMHLVKPELAGKFGLQFVRISERDRLSGQKDTVGLVVTGYNGDVSWFLDESGLRARDDAHGDRGYITPILQGLAGPEGGSLALVHPLPKALMPSITRAHKVSADRVRSYSTVNQFMTDYLHNPQLFTPPPQPVVKAAPTQTVKKTKQGKVTIGNSELLTDLLYAYRATIVGKRRGDGKITYTMKLADTPDWSMLPERSVRFESHLSQHYNHPTRLGKLLQEVLGQSLTHRMKDGHRYDIVREQIETLLPTLETMVGQKTAVLPYNFASSGVTMNENAVRFQGRKENLRARTINKDELQQQQMERLRSRTVHYYLADNGKDGPSLVAVANRRHFPNATSNDMRQVASELFQRFGFASAAALTALPLNTTDGLPSDDYAVRMPIDPTVFEDLKMQGALPILAATTDKKMLDELGTMTAQREERSRVVEPVKIKTPAPAAPVTQESIEARNARTYDAADKAMRSVMRQYSDVYFVQSRNGETVTPVAYAIVRSKDAERIRKEFSDVRFEGQQAVRFLRPHGSNKRMVRAVEITLPPGLYETLRAEDMAQSEQNSGRESRLLTSFLPDATDDVPVDSATIIQTLDEWTRTNQQELQHKEAAQTNVEVSLVQSLHAAATDPQGRVVSIKLPDAALYKAEIERLRAELSLREAQYGAISRDHSVLESHVTASVMLTPGSHHATKSLRSATMVSEHATHALDELRTQIGQLERFEKLAHDPGVLHGVVLRSAVTRLPYADRVMDSVANPQRALESKDDSPQRLVDGKIINLGRGRKHEKRAYFYLASPELWASVEPLLPESALPLSPVPVPYHALSNTIGEHYEPHHFKATDTQVTAQDALVATSKLNLHAIVANERKGADFRQQGERWRNGDQHSQPFLYIVATNNNRAQVMSALTALGSSGAIDGERVEEGTQQAVKTDTRLIDFSNRAKGVSAAHKFGRELDGEISRIGMKFQRDQDADSRKFDAQLLLSILTDPMSRAPEAENDAIEEYMEKNVARELERSAANTLLLPWLKTMAATGELPEDVTATTIREAVDGLTKLAPSVTRLQDQLAKEFDQACKADPNLQVKLHEESRGRAATAQELKDDRGDYIDVWSIRTQQHTITESIAGRTEAAISLHVQGKEPEILPWQDDKASLQSLRKQLTRMTNDAPVIIAVPLSETGKSALDPLRQASRDRHQQQIRARFETKHTPGRAVAERSARLLDTLGNSTHAQPRGEIIRHIAQFHELGGQSVER